MTITLGEDNIYLIVILALMAVQAYQLKRSFDIKKEIDQIWAQLGTLLIATSSKMVDLEKEINKKQNKNEDVRDSEASS